MINIAIDGFSGSGKSTLADGLAKNFNLKHLNTGAILRAMGVYFFEKGITEIDEKIVEEHIDNFKIHIEFDGNTQHTYLDENDVSEKIMAEIFGQMASKLAVIKIAMMKLIDISRDFAKKYDCVMEGRNITSEVLPDADVKFFLDAEVYKRAERRHKEMIERNIETSYDKVLESLKERDWRDTHRDFSPMVVVPDAEVIDNTNLSLEETVVIASEIVKNKLNNSKWVFV